MKTKILLLAATAALAVGAQAQGFRGGAGMFRAFQSGPMASAMMLNREDVKEELKLTDDQTGKLDALRSGIRDKMRNAFTEMRSAGDLGEEGQKAMQAKMRGIFEDMAKQALAVLDEAQLKRVKELTIQYQGSLAILQPDVSKALDVTPSQKAKIDDLQRMQDEANAGLFERVQNGDLERDQVGTIMQKNRATLDAEIAKMLSDAQRAKLKSLSGAPFEFKDPKPGAPGSFGRPGG